MSIVTLITEIDQWSTYSWFSIDTLSFGLLSELWNIKITTVHGRGKIRLTAAVLLTGQWIYVTTCCLRTNNTAFYDDQESIFLGRVNGVIKNIYLLQPLYIVRGVKIKIRKKQYGEQHPARRAHMGKTHSAPRAHIGKTVGDRIPDNAHYHVQCT